MKETIWRVCALEWQDQDVAGGCYGWRKERVTTSPMIITSHRSADQEAMYKIAKELTHASYDENGYGEGMDYFIVDEGELDPKAIERGYEY